MVQVKHILFVCTGNTCRSPMAEAILRQKLAESGNDRIEVQSAGVAASQGSPASHGAQQALQGRSIPADEHRAQMFTQTLGAWADLILTMTSSHKQVIARQFPQFMDKVFTLKEYVYGDHSANHDIADPFGGSLDVYEYSAAEIERAVDRLLALLDD